MRLDRVLQIYLLEPTAESVAAAQRACTGSSDLDVTFARLSFSLCRSILSTLLLLCAKIRIV
jgi:hypothetical protein